MKRKIALLLLTCSVLTACSSQAVSSQESQKMTASAPSGVEQKTATASAVSDEDIEKRIKEVGESYDGLFEQSEMDLTFSKSAAGAMTNSLSDGFAMDAEEEAIAEEHFSYPEEPIDWNTESYNSIEESGLISVKTQPFSTFGADVDTASYSSLRRRIYEDDGFGITDNALRTEELINYFNYNYPQAKDDEKFGVVTSVTPCPWVDDDNTKLLRVGIKAEEISADKGSNIVFLIDTSGSMFDNNKLPLAQKAFKMLQEQLTDKDTVSIVTYAGNEEVIAEGLKGDQHTEMTNAIDSLEAWGGYKR
ncbi:MAG: von Willebrand factor type A domain-containing protein [Firmicutes bacterium]|nr:von Willebrand factor type A domain-containing protein [Bacillota bacterium]